MRRPGASSKRPLPSLGKMPAVRFQHGGQKCQHNDRSHRRDSEPVFRQHLQQIHIRAGDNQFYTFCPIEDE